jgi:hypothetical protein
MKQIGSSGKISKTEYREWPIFETIRKEEGFMNTFSEIFGEPLLTEEIVTSQDSTVATTTKAPTNFSLDDITDAEFSFMSPAKKPN